MKNSAFLVVLLSVFGIAQFAFANHHEGGDAENGHKCEGMAHGDFSISGLDANKDGVITKKEYVAGGKANTEKLFKHLDANSDGKLDAAEQKEIEAVYKDMHEKAMPKKPISNT
jgi:hypothetical protein